MRFFDAAAVAAALPFETLVPALRAGFAEGCSVPPRLILELPAGDEAAVGAPPLTSLVMPAWQAGRYYALKCVNVAPGNAARGLPGLHASVLLHDARSGVPLAWMEGSELTSRRTAAASALAAGWLARADARRLLVVGAGRVAALLPAAYRAVRPIEQVTVWARRAEAAEALAAQWRTEGFDAAATTNLAAAAAAADIVSCATLATEPVVRGAWLRAGSHLDLIGSFTPAMREADDEAFAGAAIVVDTEEALAKSGELIGPMARGVFSRAELRGTLTVLARGEVQGRLRDDERTVFKSVGSALEDLVAAVQVWERAAAA